MICIDVCHQNNDIKVRAQSTFKTPINGEEEFYWIIARKFGSTATSAPFKSATCTRLTRTKRISYSVWSLMYGWTQMLYLVKVFFFKKKIVEGMERCSLLLLKWPSAFNTRSPFHHHHLWGWWDCCYSRIVGRVVRREGSEAKAEWKVVWLRDRSVSDEPLPSLSLFRLSSSFSPCSVVALDQDFAVALRPPTSHDAVARNSSACVLSRAVRECSILHKFT